MDLTRLQPSTYVTQTCELSPDELWPVLSRPDLLPTLSSELQAIRVVGDGPVDLGTTFEGDQQRGERRWTTLSTVTTFDPPSVFAWTVGNLDHPVSRWTFVVDAHDAGTTVAQKVELLGGPSPLSEYLIAHPEEADSIVEGRLATLRERMAVTVAGLIDLARSAAPTR